ncbi:MAG TPA: 30S ribosomal protein S20 [Verrucomicrobiota bacterium]|nr:30S ribosomal protein S20 [Verrucomicrobiota bacterium]
MQQGKKDEAAAALRTMQSALDKAVKSGVIQKATASRKKSRLSVKLASLK